jgi:large subunit ribosomal protein L30e
MVLDVHRAIRSAVSTGKVYIGARESRKALKRREAKLVIVASNCPEQFLKLLRRYKRVGVYEFEGTNMELGAACGKPFSISVLTVVEPGESNIMTLKEQQGE